LLFARRWRVFDDLGRPDEIDYETVELMEEIEANDLGLPPVDQCVPDEDGVVWF
jgi:hypothetical protein